MPPRHWTNGKGIALERVIILILERAFISHFGTRHLCCGSLLNINVFVYVYIFICRSRLYHPTPTPTLVRLATSLKSWWTVLPHPTPPHPNPIPCQIYNFFEFLVNVVARPHPNPPPHSNRPRKIVCVPIWSLSVSSVFQNDPYRSVLLLYSKLILIVCSKMILVPERTTAYHHTCTQVYLNVLTPQTTPPHPTPSEKS